MVIVTKGDHIWVEPVTKSQYSCPIGARVIDTDSGRILVVDDTKDEYWLSSDRRIKPMHATSVQGVEDMIQLGDLHESGILRTLLIRYSNRTIYTYTGSILVAVNPYSPLDIYTIDQIRAYKQKRIGELPPHIFAIADNAYMNMYEKKRQQCIIISGESGAGKTESTKLVLQFLAATSGQHSWIEQQILMANPVIEAFGNAKTVRNDNSSRFGKYIDIHFNASGAIEGARIQQYLLEKSRIVQQARHERNYHIFYCMLAGLSDEEKKNLYLSNSTNYYYLTQGSSPTADGRDDRRDFAEIRDAMKVLLFTEQDINCVFKVLAALLHMGNVKYNAAIVDNMDSTSIVDADSVTKTAKLLQLDGRQLVNALTTRTIVTRDERVISGMTPAQSLDVRDAFVKGVYGTLFVWIVKKINQAIYKSKTEATCHRIGVLDIFGFENFDTNSFEQLCINYANEHLQQFFVQHIFKMEQDEYDYEQISWQHIDFVDNQEVLDLLASRPMNILSLIDEESRFPKGSDQSMLNKLHQTHARNHNYLKPRSDLNRSFGVNHFAGVVYYDTRGFLEKDRDSFSNDLHQLIAQSKFKFLVHLFDEQVSSMAAMPNGTKRRPQTVGDKFRRSLDELMGQLSQCDPFFVRCIKPNDHKGPMTFDRELCVKQLRYSGMMETIRIRKAGYPIRHDFPQFVDRFRILCTGVGAPHTVDCREATRKICRKVFGKDADFQLGKNKLFLKDAQDLHLEQAREQAYHMKVVTIQRVVRGWVARRRFARMRNAAIVLQKTFRGYAQRKRYKQIRKGIARLQAVIRTRQLVAHYTRIRFMVIQFQAHVRGHLIRRVVHSAMRAGKKIEATPAEIVQQQRDDAVTTPMSNAQQDIDDEKLVEQMFGFLPSDNSSDIVDQSERSRFDDLQSAKSSKSSMNGTSPPIDDSRVNPDADADLSSYQFGKYAATFFQHNTTASHIRKPLRHPLLPHESTGDQIAALAVWITVLRFMGDLPEPEANGTAVRDNTPVMAKLYSTLGRNFSKKQLMAAQNVAEGDGTISRRRSNANAMRQKLISMTLKRKSKFNATAVENMKKDDYADDYNAMLENRPTSNLEKLHFIIGHGILRPDLRNEIYAQICKQLSGNSNRNSHARGWILLSLCVGCFAPNEHFVKYVRNFIREHGPTGYSAYCEQRLNRTLVNGTRHQPPSYMELQATKSKKALVLPITFMDGTTKTLLADSATTARELCQSLAQKISLQDKFGFSLYIALFDKVSSLGAGNDHVMDAVSQCEQYAREQGAQERNAPWRLFYRKEIFAPWHKPQGDTTSTTLIYQQIVRGIKYGEYRCEKEDDLAKLVAQEYFVEHGGSVEVPKLETLMTSAMPEGALNDKHADQWHQLILHAYRKTFEGREKLSAQNVREDVVSYAKYKWPLLFSRFYEAYKFAGPPLPKNEVIIAVNWTGVYVVDDQEQVLLELSFPEITNVTSTKTGRLHSETFTVCTVRGEEFVFQSPNSEDIQELIDYFLHGLRKRSRYVIALQDNKTDAQSENVPFLRGDLLALDKGLTGENVMSTGWVDGENIRTGARGHISTDLVYILPTNSKPTNDILEMFTSQPNFSPHQHQFNGSVSNVGDSHMAFGQQNGDIMHTMEAFAVDNFRSGSRKSVTLSKRRGVIDNLWRHSREPLHEPLLKKLHGKEEPSTEAIQSFLAIVKYMGDHPSRRPRYGTELTDTIFSGALKYEICRDETYCQLMKQLTDNPQRHSEERGWELMWLCAGLFPPSQSLHKQVYMFLRTRHHPVAADCLNRLQKCIRAGQRKYAPHQVEVEAIQHKTTQIFHKVYFPDDTDEAIEVESSTRARDFCSKIATRLGLKSAEGFSLFVKIADKVISVPENDFFFDFVRQLTEWIRKARPTKDGSIPQFSYQVFFMKKLWTNTLPGVDRNADLIFHYHQELPKYLRGYHLCHRDDAARLAALILKARHGDDDKTALQAAQSNVQDVLPRDLVKAQSSSEWRRAVTAAYSGEAQNMTSEDAKMHFLRAAHLWPTFGSAFFEVKQTSDPSLPERLLIAINKNGVNLIDTQTKEIMVTYPFTRISNWSSGNTYFHMTVGNLMKGNRLLLETSLQPTPQPSYFTNVTNTLLPSMSMGDCSALSTHSKPRRTRRGKSSRRQLPKNPYDSPRSMAPLNLPTMAPPVNMGYKMDDLLTSYISLMLSNMNGQTNGNANGTNGSVVGRIGYD